MQNTSQQERKSSKTPVKVITPDELCRVFRCSSAILGRGKFNLFSVQSKALKLADRLQTVLGQPVHKVSGVSSTICYKCKRELEKYEKYIQVLEVELKQFRESFTDSPWSSSRFDALRWKDVRTSHLPFLLLYLGKTGLAKIIVHLTNSSPFKKRFFNRPIRFPGSNFDSGEMNGNVIGSTRSLKRLNCLSPRSLAEQHLWHPG